jgi:hypothetical protein
LPNPKPNEKYINTPIVLIDGLMSYSLGFTYGSVGDGSVGDGSVGVVASLSTDRDEPKDQSDRRWDHFSRI